MDNWNMNSYDDNMDKDYNGKPASFFVESFLVNTI